MGDGRAPDGTLQVSFLAGPRGATVVAGLSCSGAIAARPTPWGCYLVAAAASPVGSDRIEVDIGVGPGASAEVRSTGATLARRGQRGDERSTQRVSAAVADGGTLQWLVEPGIAAAGAYHLGEARISLGTHARLAWREEIVLGRVGEVPGNWTASIAIERAGRPLLATAVGLGPASATWALPSVTDGARAYCELVIVDPERGAGSWPGIALERDGARAVSTPLAGPAIVIGAWGAHHRACRDALASLLVAVGAPPWLAADAAVRPGSAA